MLFNMPADRFVWRMVGTGGGREWGTFRPLLSTLSRAIADAFLVRSTYFFLFKKAQRTSIESGKKNKLKPFIYVSNIQMIVVGDRVRVCEKVKEFSSFCMRLNDFQAQLNAGKMRI